MQALAFAPRGGLLAVGGIDWLATGGTDGAVHVWDVKEKVLVNEFRAQDRSITAMVRSFDGKRLLTTSEDKKAKIWKMADLIPDGD